MDRCQSNNTSKKVWFDTHQSSICCNTAFMQLPKTKMNEEIYINAENNFTNAFANTLEMFYKIII